MGLRSLLLGQLGVVSPPPLRGVALARTMDALRRALEASRDGGCSARFDGSEPAGPSDVATTAAVVDALSAYAARSGQPEWQNLARRAALWLASFPGRSAGWPIPDVIAMVRGCGAFLATEPEARVALPVQRVSVSLLERLDGAAGGPAHAVSVAALLEVLRGSASFGRATSVARRVLDQSVAAQTRSGWLDCEWDGADPRAGRAAPLLHLTNAIDGLLRAAGLLGDVRYAEAALCAGEGLLRSFEVHRSLARAYRDGWKPVPDRWLGGSSVSTLGLSRAAKSWLELARASGRLPFLSAALKANDVVSAIVETGAGYADGVHGMVAAFPEPKRGWRFPAAAAHHASALLAEEAALDALVERHAPDRSQPL